ncbi:nucleotidyl transferase AbiEii/AbiGii toxin family protein [Nocardia niigatensis]|uniref:nucleotidyl transferase AbiEii/AbiGii toxin family protein n=1 Tax=Nocardia niigatensis TaxID=209249 RepID=UPI001C3F3A55|nr:nucleotidyl transferase AbiEii/AbiGii toxin family protein [Nocardia niigatensis]
MERTPGFRVAQRAALDHMLALIAESPWGRGLVLRGSMTMAAWVGDAARAPGDLDWIVPEPSEVAFTDPADPFPFVDDLSWVQHWPEAAFGAVSDEMWEDEEFESFGLRPILPPEGLHWVDPDDYSENHTWSPLLDSLTETIRERPEGSAGVVLDAGGIDGGTDGGYSLDYYDTPGLRVRVPWYTIGPETMAGEVQLDFAADQSLPDSPVWTLVPRGDGHAATPCVTASPEVSLAWKLLWLYTDSSESDEYGDSRAGGAGKDLYDAVLLAESPRIQLSWSLLRRVLGEAADDFEADDILAWRVNWDRFQQHNPGVTGTVREWLERLVHALTRHLVQPSESR